MQSLDWSRPLRLRDHPHIKVVGHREPIIDSETTRVVDFSEPPPGTPGTLGPLGWIYRHDGTRNARYTACISPLEYDGDVDWTKPVYFGEQLVRVLATDLDDRDGFTVVLTRSTGSGASEIFQAHRDTGKLIGGFSKVSNELPPIKRYCRASSDGKIDTNPIHANLILTFDRQSKHLIDAKVSSI